MHAFMYMHKIYIQAAWYPDHPTTLEQQHMNQFMQALAIFYPCTYCATDFQQAIQEKPIVTTSRKELCQWLCQQHNVVNTKLGKPTFPCDIETLDERWRKQQQDGNTCE